MSDTSNRNDVESLLEAGDANFKAVVQLSPLPIVISTFSDRRVVLANDAFWRNTGHSGDKMTGKDEAGLKLYSEPHDQTRLRELLQEKGQVDDFRVRLRDKSRRHYDTKISARLIHYQGQECILSITTSFIHVKRAEEAVRASEKRFFNILERIAEGYFEVDLAGRFTFFNQAFCRITGYTSDELKTMSYLDYTTPEVSKSLYKIYNGVFQTRQKTVANYEIINKAGHRVHVETSVGLLCDKTDKPTGFYGVMRDRTQQHSIEEALRKSEESYRSFLELAPDVVTIGRMEDGRYLYVNDAFCQKTGYSVEETLGRTPVEINLYADTQTRKAFVHQLRRDGLVRDMEISYRSKDGTIRIDLVSGCQVRYQGQDCLLVITKDITTLKEAEQAVRRSEESLRITLNSIGDAVIATDTRGRITSMNPVAEGLTGWPFEEAKGRDLAEVFRIINEKTRREAANPVTRVLAQGRIVGLGNSTLLISRRDEEFPISDSAAPIRDAGGELAGVVLVFRDVTAKRKADRSLRESEKKHRTVLESMEEGYFEIDLKGNIVNFNASTLRLHGYSAKEFTGMPFGQSLHADTAAKMVQIFSRVFETGHPTPILEYEVIRKDGSVRVCEMSAYPMRSPTDEIIGFWGITRDRTERKNAEIALQESEARLRTIFESAAVGIAYYNVQDEFIRVNKGFCDIVGYSPNELLLKKAAELSHPDDRDLDRQEIDQLLRGEKRSFGMERRLVRKDGTLVWCKTSVALAYGDREDPMYFVAVIEDITERRRAQQALEQSEERYRLLVDNANEGICITRDGSIQYLNPRAIEILGGSIAELIGFPFADLAHPKDRETVYAVQQCRPEDEKRPGVFAFRLVNLQKEELWVELSTVEIVWDDAPASLNFLRDITQQKKMESQLLQAQKMEAVGTLAGGVAHDFNNLLMGIQGNVSLALIDMDGTHEHYQRLKNIEYYVKAGADLTRQLLGAAKGGKYETQPTDLNKILDASSELFGRTKKEITIFKKFQEDLWIVDVDRGQIDQVLLNLYVNAWQAMPEGGKLYLESKNVILDKDYIRPYGVEPGNYVRISITDTGIGIEEKHIKRIFDPFYTTKGMSRGTGLGLASAYGIIANHGGIITVYSEKGSGTTFNIYLPISDKEIIEAAAPDSDILTGHETLLFVDDEEGILKVGRLILEKLGYYVISALGGEEAVEIFSQRHDQIELVILDMIMPDLSGSDTYDALKKINPEVKVILSSGYSINGQAKSILERGCKGFIQKPFSLKDLSVKLRQILDADDCSNP